MYYVRIEYDDETIDYYEWLTRQEADVILTIHDDTFIGLMDHRVPIWKTK
jgi:hypothetical protein